jgi:predicted secreted protein
MGLVKGDNVILFIYDGGMWKPVVCGTSCSFQTDAEDIETSITGSGAWRTYEYVALTWTCSFDGVILLDGLNELSLQDLRSYQYSRQKVLIRYQREDDSANVYTDEGYALITSISDTGDLDSMATFSVSLKGTGPLTSVLAPTPVDPTAKVKRFEYTGIAGETSFTDGDLISKDILDVVVDGVGRSQIITSGTPVDQEAKYYSGLGKIEVPIPLDNGIEVYVLYQDL